VSTNQKALSFLGEFLKAFPTKHQRMQGGLKMPNMGLFLFGALLFFLLLAAAIAYIFENIRRKGR